MVDEKQQEAYDAGVLAQRLAQYDDHFKVINGSIGETATELKRISSLMQEMLSKVVLREGPIMDQVNKNTRRLDQIEDREKTIAEETEHRRLKLADKRAGEIDSFVKRHSTTGLSLSIITILLGFAYFLVSHL